MKRILAVGAFERDNFGDLLFLRVLRDFVKDKDAEITPASIIFSDMRRVNGEVVYPYDLMLKLFKWDAVWVVGGEVGGVDITGAVMMDSIGKKGQHYSALTDNDKEAYNTLLHIPRGNGLSAYLPDLENYDINRKTTMIVNSAGLSNATLNLEMLKNEVAILSRSSVSVREANSAKFCEENRIHYSLSPDVVTAIAQFHRLRKKHTKDPYIVVQINRGLLSQTKLASLSSDLKDISEYLGANIILLSAGVTFGHDDDSLYEKIITKFKTLSPKYTIEQFEDRDPLAITGLIAQSRLCIATSLHCRIVSESYNVPRIALSNKKVANYVATWAEYDEYPYDIDINLLKDTVVEIKDKIDAPVENNHLSQMALDNLEKQYNKIKEQVKTPEYNSGSYDDLNALFISYANNQKDALDTVYTDVLAERRTFIVQIQELARDAQELANQAAQHTTTIQNLENSRTYRVGLLITAPYRISRKLIRRLKNKNTSIGKD